MLYRLLPSSEPALPTLAADLALHVRYAPFTTLLMQIGNRQQAYLSSSGCSGCLQRRCTAHCHMQLLRRMLIANGAVEDLCSIPNGLAQRPYTRLAYAIPGKQAQTLTAAILSPWQDVRIWVQWRTFLGKQIVTATLAVGEDGPDPLDAFHAYGWHGIVAPHAIVAQLIRHDLAMLPFGGLWPATPFVLLPPMPESPAPQAFSQPAIQETPHISAEEFELASQKLAMLLLDTGASSSLADGAFAPLQVCVETAQLRSADLHNLNESSVPIGLSEARLPAILATIATSEVAHAGLGIQRMRKLVDLTRGEAALLLCWLDLAGLVEAPRPGQNGQNPWREPRPLNTNDLAAITAQLNATPRPSAEDLALAFPQYLNKYTKPTQDIASHQNLASQSG